MLCEKELWYRLQGRAGLDGLLNFSSDWRSVLWEYSKTAELTQAWQAIDVGV